MIIIMTVAHLTYFQILEIISNLFMIFTAYNFKLVHLTVFIMYSLFTNIVIEITFYCASLHCAFQI